MLAGMCEHKTGIESAEAGDAINATELDEMARRLYEIMERLDPTDSAPWSSASEYDKIFMRNCVREFLYEYRAYCNLIR